jgi:RluA family pseudouridine synthase
MALQKFTYTKKNNLQTLSDFIANKLTISKKKVKHLLDSRRVFVNKRRIWIASYQLNHGDMIEIISKETEPFDVQEGNILFRDDYYLIVSKPPNIVTNGEESLEYKLRVFFKDNRIRAVHRLDKNTSGVVIFAMNKDGFEQMKPLFKVNLIKKVYRVIVKGSLGKRLFTIDTPLNGQKAVTHIQLLKRGGNASYLEVNTDTGRTHQIRIHLASAGYPVMGETEYNRKPVEGQLHRQIQRQMLHAYQISFVHPYTQKCVSVTAEIPDDFKQCLKTFHLTE